MTRTRIGGAVAMALAASVVLAAAGPQHVPVFSVENELRLEGGDQ